MFWLPHALLFVSLLFQEQDKTTCSTNDFIISRNTEPTFDSWNWLVSDENYGQSSIISLEGQYFLLLTIRHNCLLSLVQNEHCWDAWQKLDFLNTTPSFVIVMMKDPNRASRWGVGAAPPRRITAVGLNSYLPGNMLGRIDRNML